MFSMALKTFFPKDNIIPNKEALELWYRQLYDIPYSIAETFLQKWVATNKWSPSIAEIREGCIVITEGELPDWGDGWKEVLKCIARYGYMREEEALNHMSPMTRKVVERLGWKNLCFSENEVADRANFRNCYEIISKREVEDRQLPAALKETISQIQIGAGSAKALPGKD